MNEVGLKTSCWYCSGTSSAETFDQEFGVKVKWDIPLFEGYEYKAFKNYSWKPSISKGFFGLMNFGMIRQLSKIPKSVIIVHGWHYFTLFSVLMTARFFGHTVCLRTETPDNHENLKPGFKQKIKRFVFKNVLFRRIHYFLYIGEQNKKFYNSYGIDDDRLLLCPYSVDNKRFQSEAAKLQDKKLNIKESLGIPATGKVILFSAKYITKKNPLDILNAFAELDRENLWLVMVGDGELRPDMEALIKTKNINHVILTGFVNQSKIPEYYAIGDVFVMCSGQGETWGLSVNEAMNFNLPVILSDLTGSAKNLVVEGSNGYTFKTFDIPDLVAKLNLVVKDNALSQQPSSREIIEGYSYDAIIKNIKTLV